jgi:hypothetical protein
MAIIDLANQADAIQRVLVAEMATEGVAGISWQGDDGALADEFGSLHEQAWLRRFGMNIDDTGHDQATRRQTGFKSSGSCGSLPRST